MIQSKIKVKENDENGVGVLKRSTVEVDHWAFLEEIEAPMWADLSLEPKLITEDNDDPWFHTSHPFHHHSARHLRSAFAHPDVGNNLFNVNLQGACSPQLPPSVSKSRGKDYRGRDWKSNCDQISLSKGHPINNLGGRNSESKSLPSQEGKFNASCGNQSSASSSITTVVDDSKRRIGLNSQSTSTTGASTSTLTTVSWQQDVKVLNEVGQPGGLLNSLRINLRRSRATRPASRVVINDDGESKGQKSSAGKSSVGSSSTGNDTKGKGSEVLPKTDQYNLGSNVNKTSAGKSSMGSSSTGNDTKGKGSEVLPKTDRYNLGSNVNKTSAGKSSVGSSSTGNDSKGKGSAVSPKTYRCKIGSKVHKTSFVRSNSGSSNPSAEVKKVAAGSKQYKDKNLNVRDLKESENPVNGRVIGKKMVEASVCTRTNAYSSKIKGNGTGARSNAGARNAFSSKIKGNDVAVTCNSKGASRSKVLLQTTQRSSLSRTRTGSQGVKGKGGSCQLNDFACSGKENMRGRAGIIRRSGDKVNVPVLRESDHKISKFKSKGKVGATSIGTKVRTGMKNDGIISLDTRLHLR